MTALMAGLARITAALKKKVKKHGVKAGQKSKIRPSQKKSVKNGKQLLKQAPKAKEVTKSKPIVDKAIVTAAELDEDVFGDVGVDLYDENDEYLETDEDLTEYEPGDKLNN